MAWFRSTARPNRFLRSRQGWSPPRIPYARARYARALAAVRHEYRDRIASIGEPKRPPTS
jgi:hypothetical protein